MAAENPLFRHSESGQKLVEGNGQFSWGMYKKLAAEAKGDNVFYSPLSISIALAMTYLGARNQTRDEMRSVQGFTELEDEHLHACFEDLHTLLHNTGGHYTLHTANRIYLEETFNVLSPFLEATKSHYKAEVATVDFIKQFDDARLAINKWVEEKTANKIKDVLAQGVLDSLTRLVLVNAIYFKGNWAQQFDPAKTKDEPFLLSQSEKVPVKLMYQEEKFNYGYSQELGAKVLEMPYVSNKLSMLLLLPTTYHGLDEVVSKLTAEHIHNFKKTFKMFNIKTQVHLPRFKLEQSFDLGDTLSAMGMKDLFDQGRADLSGIDGSNELYVSKIVHKAFIEVNEEGSEAAAATIVKLGLRSMPKFMEFRADQPFLFFIRENASNSILFSGRMSKPSPAEAAGAKEEL